MLPAPGWSAILEVIADPWSVDHEYDHDVHTPGEGVQTR
jgi:hypothetical protein